MRAAPAPVLFVLALVGMVGIVHGMWTDRWGPSGQLQQALAALPRVPAAFGDWAGEDDSLDADALTVGGIKGYINRRYKNSRTGETVAFLIVCGRGGPMSVHTPEVCYAGAGYQPVGQEQRRAVETDAQADEFAVRKFRKVGVVPTQLEIYWAWSRDGVTWQVPADSRVTLARYPALYKMYVVREYVPGSQAESLTSCQEFLRRALPDIRQALSSSDP
ncbi:MAG TPA: exosortase-associated EpsI family protein [Gemmataceae bacterium]|nr:exosortase-associated EpsI family protein [Gemmataceae bacterium]